VTPTTDQLNEWAAEALGWVLNQAVAPNVYMNIDRYVTKTHSDWHPSTSLSQAWREFVPVLNVKGMVIEIMQGLGGVVRIHTWGDQAKLIAEFYYRNGTDKDFDPAYALTYATIQAMKPKGYLEWKGGAK